MFGRSRPDRVQCRFGGEHAVLSERLRIATPRFRDLVGIWRHLTRDADAQHWLGCGPADAPKDISAVGDLDPLQISPDYLAFVGVETQTGYTVASVDLTRCDDGVYEVGGVVDAAFRGQGYGREILAAVCTLAHQHFGFAQLRAGFERTNVASLHWLAACGFAGFDPPRRHVLPNGREVEGLWWHRTDRSARRRCRNPAMD